MKCEATVVTLLILVPFNPARAAARCILDIYTIQLPPPGPASAVYNVGKIHGGDVVNAIAQDVYFTVDLRTVDPELLPNLDAQILAKPQLRVSEGDDLPVTQIALGETLTASLAQPVSGSVTVRVRDTNRAVGDRDADHGPAVVERGLVEDRRDLDPVLEDIGPHVVLRPHQPHALGQVSLGDPQNAKVGVAAGRGRVLFAVNPLAQLQ